MIGNRSMRLGRCYLHRFMLLGMVVALLLAGCFRSSPEPPQPESIVEPAEMDTPVQPSAQTESQAETTEGQTNRTIPPRAEPLSQEDALPPVLLTIPAIDMSVEIVPMGWRTAEVDGQRTTVWVLPDAGAGWHPTSAGAGAAGNTVISGHQLLGDAAFAPIALGDVAVDQEIVLADAEGRSFTYRVTDVSEPLPITENLEQEEALAALYTAQGEEPILTLVTGWPDFSSTHRVVVTAELLGSSQ